MYDFTTDWFSQRIESWTHHLSHLKGQPVRTLEIGSHEGRSAIWVLENILTHEESRLTCIDPWRCCEAESRFDANLAKSGLSCKVVKLKSQSHIAARFLPLEHFDFVYIDGDHEAASVLEDAVSAYRLLKPGGILIFDDYQWEGDKVGTPPKPAIDAFLSIYGERVEELERNWQIVCRKS